MQSQLTITENVLHISIYVIKFVINIIQNKLTLKFCTLQVNNDQSILGTDVQVKWTVINAGTGATRRGYWTDRLWISTNNTLGKTSGLYRVLLAISTADTSD